MRKSVFTSLLLLALPFIGICQYRYAGYIIHERDQNTVMNAITTYYIKTHLIIPAKQNIPDSFNNKESGFKSYKESSTNIDKYNKSLVYNCTAKASVNSLLIMPDLRIKPSFKINNITNSDSIDVNGAFFKIQPLYFGSSLDTGMPCNAQYPLVMSKGKSLRFNAFNIPTEADNVSEIVHPNEIPFLKNLNIISDQNTSELIFHPKDTGYYLLASNVVVNGGGYYETFAFYTVYVSSDSTLVPSGYFLYNGRSYADTFLHIAPKLPDGALKLEYNYVNADSVKFGLLPLQKPYKGFNLNTTQDSSKYKLMISWDKNAFINQFSELTNKRFINVLVSKYKAGMPYYETFTVAFDEPGNVSTERNYQHLSPIKVFPNPSHENINIEAPRTGSYQYKLIQCTGETLYEGKWDNSITYVLNTGHIPAGMYMLQINDLKSNEIFYNKVFIY